MAAHSPIIVVAIALLLAVLGVNFLAVNAAGTADIALGEVHQSIDGFGGSTAWLGALSDKAMDTLFGNENSKQVGLSIIRLRIDPNKDWAAEQSNAKKASARGAKVMATPWTAPASMKTNNNVVGGSLKTSSYAEYADYLKSFADGAHLDVISVQNEPDIKVTYESMDWSPEEMVAFLKGYRSRIGSTKVMAAESFQFRKDITDAILNDGGAASQVDIIGGHIYGGGLSEYPLAASKGKPVWMTEHQNDGSDWSSIMATAKEIHDCMTVANFNAYLVWWFWDNSGNTAPLDSVESGNPTDRAFIIGQWAKYVRPGYQRVEATASPSTNVFVSAFKGSGKVVIVAVNTGGSEVSQQFSVSGGTVPSSFTPHITSQSKKISDEANVSVSGGSFTFSLPSQSVTTFVST